MRTDIVVKHWLKLLRWRFRRAGAALRWGNAQLQQTPAVLGAAMPKSGSHLISQILRGLTQLGPFVAPGFPPVNRREDNSILPPQAVLANIQRMCPGDLRYGYIRHEAPFVEALTQPGRAMTFVYRDPRDLIISSIHYATEMHEGHGMHTYYTERLTSIEARINAEIFGVEEPGFEFPDIRTRYERYLGWLAQPETLSLRFEDLILDRDAALGRIWDYLETRGFTATVSRERAVEVLKESIAPKKSGTFRKGQPGNWREHFTEANKTAFKEAAGDLLMRLKYEQNNDW